MCMIKVQACDVWDYYWKNVKRLFNQYEEIAEADEYGVRIYLGTDDLSDSVDFAEHMPCVIVSIDCEEVLTMIPGSADTCEVDVQGIYDDYLYGDFEKMAADYKDDYMDEYEKYLAGEYGYLEEDDLIDTRELELDDAMFDMISDVAPEFMDIVEDVGEVCEYFKDLICEKLYTEFDVSVYRPMRLEDQNGNEEFSLYPYEEMEIE